MKAIRIGLDSPVIIFINNITHITALDMRCTIHLSSGKEIEVFFDLNHLLYLISAADENFKEIVIDHKYPSYLRQNNSVIASLQNDTVITASLQNDTVLTVSYSINNIPSQTIEQ